jgi:hypothetical protein
LQILCLKDAELTKLPCLCAEIDCSECEICQGSKKFSAAELQALFTKFVPSTKKFEEFDQVIFESVTFLGLVHKRIFPHALEAEWVPKGSAVKSDSHHAHSHISDTQNVIFVNSLN